MTSEKLFPVLLTEDERKQYPHCPAGIPWRPVELHWARGTEPAAEQRKELEQVVEQGGLPPRALYEVLNDLPAGAASGVGLDVAIGFLAAYARRDDLGQAAQSNPSI